jgi:23S rRNA pseudouridine1911/1915/1917 synthase
VSILERLYNQKFLPIHRLDRETSGAILLGKNNEAASSVQSAFDNVSKMYTAIVKGGIEGKSFIIDVPLGQARNSSIRKKREAFFGAPEKAVTEFSIISVSSDREFSLVNAFPVTGRMHQIRAHLSYAGYPIIGDKIYGKDESIYLRYVEEGESNELENRAGFKRCALHSSYIKFYHPYEKSFIEINAPFLPDMEEFIEKNGL